MQYDPAGARRAKIQAGETVVGVVLPINPYAFWNEAIRGVKDAMAALKGAHLTLSLYAGMHSEADALYCLDYMEDMRADVLVAVSYTHLDVYKRQVLGHRGHHPGLHPAGAQIQQAVGQLRFITGEEILSMPSGESAVLKERPKVKKRIKWKSGLLRALLYVVIILFGVTFAFPFFLTLMNSLKPLTASVGLSQIIPSEFHWENYYYAVTLIPFFKYLLNSLIIVAIVVPMCTIINMVIGYAFARLRARGKDVMFVIVLSTMMIPGIVTMIPQYILYNVLGITDTFFKMCIRDRIYTIRCRSPSRERVTFPGWRRVRTVSYTHLPINPGVRSRPRAL